VTESSRSAYQDQSKIRSTWDRDRVSLLLKTNLEEIERKRPSFFGTLKIEVNYRDGQIETVAVDCRQTFKD
jgi:hypothetical protein